MTERNRIAALEIDPSSLAPSSPESEHERKIAVFDLIEENSFELVGQDRGPYAINLSMIENRLVFQVNHESGETIHQFMLSLTPLKRVIKDYFMICDSYYNAIRDASPGHIEAIDMGRRGLHNEGSELLIQRLEGKVVLDFDTARRLFTLVCALHVRL